MFRCSFIWISFSCNFLPHDPLRKCLILSKPYDYKVIKKLGGGAFGDIYKVEKRKTGDLLAAKVEKAVKNVKHIILFWESKLIHKLRGKTAVPNLHFVGDEKTEDGKMYHVMVMDLKVK